MRDHWRRLSLRDMSRFVGVVAIVAVVGVVIGREAGIGRQTGASVAPSPADESLPLPQQQSEETAALTLTLSAPEICETERGRPYAGSEIVYDDDGKAISTRDISTGWAGVAEIPVSWEVSGGTAPYTLAIDNETRDGDGPYEGTSGTASVSCAAPSAEVFYTSYNERRFRGDPQIDSGAKTIRVVVTDANGTTVEASLSTYVILNVAADLYVGPDGTPVHYRFNKGRTYRVNGFLMTFPSDAFSSSSTEADGGESSFSIKFFLDGHRGLIHIGADTGLEVGRRIESYLRKTDSLRGESEHDDPEAALNSFLNELVESVGQPPVVTSP